MSDRQVLQFPLKWEYRVFADAALAEQVRASLVLLLNSYAANSAVRTGNVSASGKYQILIAEVQLPSREIMTRIAADMAKIAGVRYVL